MHVGCTGDEIRQILEGVTDWIVSMVDGSADPFGDIAFAKKSGELSSITAHVADAIFQMAGNMDGLGASNDMNVEITYELDFGVSHWKFSLIDSCFAVALYSVSSLNSSFCVAVGNCRHL